MQFCSPLSLDLSWFSYGKLLSYWTIVPAHGELSRSNAATWFSSRFRGWHGAWEWVPSRICWSISWTVRLDVEDWAENRLEPLFYNSVGLLSHFSIEIRWGKRKRRVLTSLSVLSATAFTVRWQGIFPVERIKTIRRSWFLALQRGRKGMKQFRRVRDIAALTLSTIDGQMGSISELYFDDQNWKVRYLIINTGAPVHHE